jgi:hypothetical protein
MPKRSRKRLPDPSELAFAIVQTLDPPAQSPATPAEGKDPAAVALGRKGGLGGKPRARKLTNAQRVASAKKAAAQWAWEKR